MPGNLPLSLSLSLSLSLFPVLSSTLSRDALRTAMVFVCITKSPRHGRTAADDREICKFWVGPRGSIDPYLNQSPIKKKKKKRKREARWVFTSTRITSKLAAGTRDTRNLPLVVRVSCTMTLRNYQKEIYL